MCTGGAGDACSHWFLTNFFSNVELMGLTCDWGLDGEWDGGGMFLLLFKLLAMFTSVISYHG